jgi:hypothetical protein
MRTTADFRTDKRGPGEPEGSVLVFIDESYEPFVAAAAVVVESTEADRLDTDISAVFEKMRGWFYLDGLPSFEEFRRTGFHSTSNPIEVRTAFVAFLAEVLSFKSLIVYSDGTSRPDLSKKQRLMIVYDNLVRDVLRAYRSRPRILFHFESAQSMDLYVEKVVRRAGRAEHIRSDVRVKFGTKRHPDLLATPDYVLHIFNRWRVTQGADSLILDPLSHESRSFRAILGSLSSARSLEGAAVVRRTIEADVQDGQ